MQGQMCPLSIKQKYILYLIQVFGKWSYVGRTSAWLYTECLFSAICLHPIHILPSLFWIVTCFYTLHCNAIKIHFDKFGRGPILVMGQCWLLCAFAFCWMRAYSVENVWTFYYMIVYFILWSMSKCIFYSWVYGSIFCPRRPFSNRSKHKSSKSCHQPQYAIQNTTIRNATICNT